MLSSINDRHITMVVKMVLFAAFFVVVGFLVDQGIYHTATASNKPKDPVGYEARSGNGSYYYSTVHTPDGDVACMERSGYREYGLSCNWEKFNLDNKVGTK